MTKNKSTTSKGGDFIKGGSAKMSGPNHAGPQKPGVSTQEGAKTGGKFAAGGSNKMFGKQCAGPQKPGVSGHDVGSGGKFAQGGKGHMFGYTGSKTATPS